MIKQEPINVCWSSTIEHAHEIHLSKVAGVSERSADTFGHFQRMKLRMECLISLSCESRFKLDFPTEIDIQVKSILLVYCFLTGTKTIRVFEYSSTNKKTITQSQ